MLLAALVLLTLAALGGARLELSLRRRQLTRLARGAGWEYQRSCSPELLDTAIRHLPALGAADVRVTDVLRRSGTLRLDIACVEYTLGSVRQRRDSARIVAIVHGPDGQVVTVETAPHDLPRLDQYRHLVELLAARR